MKIFAPLKKFSATVRRILPAADERDGASGGIKTACISRDEKFRLLEQHR
ncbi:MAG TPA: hypothetical protein VMV89_10525 [Candidatus Paceibacterota bacterium]|nr:hypothetical protein [Candidatus Paceibacterota bacterium]